MNPCHASLVEGSSLVLKKRFTLIKKFLGFSSRSYTPLEPIQTGPAVLRGAVSDQDPPPLPTGIEEERGRMD